MKGGRGGNYTEYDAIKASQHNKQEEDIRKKSLANMEPQGRARHLTAMKASQT